MSAMQSAPCWDGHEWEKYCLLLIRRHYGADQVQEVPAGHGGDLGIEAFSYDGTAFQCYAAEEPLNTADRYKSQRDKLTTDLSKLIKNKDELATLLGRVQIKRYIFMVPHHDSARLVQHASRKAEECRDRGLAFLSPDFEIVVLTDKAYAQARNEVLERVKSLVAIQHAEPEEITRWVDDNRGLVQAADAKLGRLPLSTAAERSYLDQLIRTYVDASNAVDRLRNEYPDQWEDIARCRTHKETVLCLEYPPSTLSQPTSIKDVATEFQAELQQKVPAMDHELGRLLSWASVADWLMRCPLSIDMPEDGAA